MADTQHLPTEAQVSGVALVAQRKAVRRRTVLRRMVGTRVGKLAIERITEIYIGHCMGWRSRGRSFTV
jgi:hypothetical protein